MNLSPENVCYVSYIFPSKQEALTEKSYYDVGKVELTALWSQGEHFFESDDISISPAFRAFFALISKPAKVNHQRNNFD